MIAGDINTVKQTSTSASFGASAMMKTASAPSFSEQSFADYHMYTLSETVTLNDKSQKQVQFIPTVYGANVRKYNLVSINAGGYNQQGIKASNKV